MDYVSGKELKHNFCYSLLCRCVCASLFHLVWMLFRRKPLCLAAAQTSKTNHISGEIGFQSRRKWLSGKRIFASIPVEPLLDSTLSNRSQSFPTQRPPYRPSLRWPAWLSSFCTRSTFSRQILSLPDFELWGNRYFSALAAAETTEIPSCYRACGCTKEGMKENAETNIRHSQQSRERESKIQPKVSENKRKSN